MLRSNLNPSTATGRLGVYSLPAVGLFGGQLNDDLSLWTGARHRRFDMVLVDEPDVTCMLDTSGVRTVPFHCQRSLVPSAAEDPGVLIVDETGHPPP